MSKIFKNAINIVQNEKNNLSVKCFLCNKSFIESKDETCYLFEKRANGDDDECPVSIILGSAFARELNEENVHSKVLCDACNLLTLEYESIEQRYFQLKYKLIEEYNKTAKIYGLDMVEFEISVQEVHDFDHFNNEECIDEDTDQEETKSHVQTDILSFFTTKSDDQNTFEIPVENFEIKSNEIVEDDDCVEDLVNIITEVVEEQSLNIDDEQHENLDDHINFQVNDIKEESTFTENNIEIKELENFIEPKKIEDNTESITTDNSRPSFQFDGDKFICLCCKEVDDSQEYDARSIGIHLKTAHNIRMYICDICGKSFGKRFALTEHVDLMHSGNEDGEFQCETCLRIFTNLRLFKIHRRMHYNITKTFECYVCNKKYTSKNLLEEHMNMHTGERPFKCEECSKDFASKYTLTAHMKIHANRPRPFACNNCTKSFFSAQNLHQHQKTHSGVKEFSCDVCSKAFGTQHNLDVHKVVHTGYKPFICRTCGKAFARRAEIRDHERTHTGEKPFSCEICGMSFAQRSNLTTHKRATHMNDKRYKCSECDRCFKRRRLLDYHIRASHTGERPYKCEMCNSSFVYPEHFKKHVKLHTGEKPYSCEVCGKTFNSRDNRNAHRFIHSDKKPYECLVCGMGFMRKPALYNHMQTMGHVNDSIVINQTQIKSDNIKINENVVQVFVNTEEMLVDDESNDIILEEEHLVEHMTEIDNESQGLREDDDSIDNNGSGNIISTTVIMSGEEEITCN